MKKTPSYAVDRQYVRDGYTFLEKQLEKMDAKILEPLESTSWPRDMPVETGGGFLENISSIDVEYATTGGDENSLIMEAANDIPVMQADFGKTTWRVFNWAHYFRVPYLQKEKLTQIGTNIEEVLNKGVRLYHDKTVDRNVYKGFVKVGSTGLINNAGVTRVTADPHTSGGSDTTWAVKTADDILNDVNKAISAIWEANDCSPDAIPNHILIPVEQFGSLVSRKVGVTGDKSIMTYLMENNLAKQQGVELVISPCKWCKQAGTSSADRMVVYVNDVSKIKFNLCAPLKRLTTEVADLQYKVPFVSAFSEVRFLYPTLVRYVDGI